MSSFFTLPASQKKRKRPQSSEQASGKANTASKRKAAHDDESISGSDASEDDAPVGRADGYESSEDEEEEFANEDPAAKRIRLAEQYLANTQKEVLEDGGFDAAEVDKENLSRRMGDRLKEDTAESKGKLYRWLADGLDWRRADQKVARTDGKSVSGVAVHGSFVYTASKDMSISKWELPPNQRNIGGEKKSQRLRKKPKRIAYTRGGKGNKGDRDAQHHHAAILCIAVSSDGRFLVTGGADNKLIVWDASTLKTLKVFIQHRDSVTSLAFRRGTNQLYSASKDRTVKIWSLNELAYVETLFGHQDEVVDVSALAQEKCVTVGARDRTARLWKVVEESQLVFRGGGAPSTKSRTAKDSLRDDSGIDTPATAKSYNEGSMDRVACIDDETFITGSDNGSLSLWNIHKKKPVFTYPLAHGVDPSPPAEQLSAELHPDEDIVARDPQPRWITALRAIPFSDTFVTGSWDGYVRAWRITQDKRRIESLGAIGAVENSLENMLESEGLSSESLSSSALKAMRDGTETAGKVRGVINDLAVVDRGERGKDGLLVVAGVGKEHRLGRWREVTESKVGFVAFEVSRITTVEEASEDADAAAPDGAEDGDFTGFE